MLCFYFNEKFSTVNYSQKIVMVDESIQLHSTKMLITLHWFWVVCGLPLISEWAWLCFIAGRSWSHLVLRLEMGSTGHSARTLGLFAPEYIWKGWVQHLLIGSCLLYTAFCNSYCVLLQPTGNIKMTFKGSSHVQKRHLS